MTDEQLEKLLNNCNKKRIQKEHDADPIDEETLKKLRRSTGNSRSGKVGGAVTANKILICPHCEASGKLLQMTRWHFDNCKKKCVDTENNCTLSVDQ